VTGSESHRTSAASHYFFRLDWRAFAVAISHKETCCSAKNAS
jgi:hypothetical protein